MRVLIFGKSGQVARELGALKWPAGWVVAFRERLECDLASGGAAARAISHFKPALVINAAAYTAVDKAETDRALARAVNEEAPGEMALAARVEGAKLIHISTDYVFDGKAKQPYKETDACRPLGVYGATKLAGEILVRKSLPEHVILRTSWVFSPYGKNFMRTMLRLGETQREVAVVGDQQGGPTAAADIAAAIFKIASGIAAGKADWGVFHFTGAPVTTWHDFAAAIFREAAARGLRTPKTVKRITTAEYPTPARRPANSALDCGAILKAWGIAQPSWEAALKNSLDVLTQGQQAGRQKP
jgi:dTDP-4-dehydrorhamnose reductase